MILGFPIVGGAPGQSAPGQSDSVTWKTGYMNPTRCIHEWYGVCLWYKACSTVIDAVGHYRPMWKEVK